MIADRKLGASKVSVPVGVITPSVSAVPVTLKVAGASLSSRCCSTGRHGGVIARRRAVARGEGLNCARRDLSHERRTMGTTLIGEALGVGGKPASAWRTEYPPGRSP